MRPNRGGAAGAFRMDEEDAAKHLAVRKQLSRFDEYHGWSLLDDIALCLRVSVVKKDFSAPQRLRG